MADKSPNLEHGKYCYAIVESSKDENGYIPVLVIEDEAGYYPMTGNGVGAAPWYWGKVREEADRAARYANARLGLTPERAAVIVSSSFAASKQAMRNSYNRFNHD